MGEGIPAGNLSQVMDTPVVKELNDGIGFLMHVYGLLSQDSICSNVDAISPPGTLEIFWIISGRDFLHNRQILEESLLGILDSKSCCLGKLRYLVSSTLFHHDEGPVTNLHTIFAPKARFKNFGNLIPRPPLS